ncbi:MAG: polyprenyl synthetase family protein [Bacteroidota bacterium]|nr:polyprenyl synthetase family protein [Bacteroidota bacterium]
MTNFKRKYRAYKSLIDSRLARCVTKNDPASLYKPLKYILSGGGKRIRPLLILLSCEAVGGKARDALHAAVAIEIVHNFTLVHDDIMDHAASRRGRPTVHTQWDENVAILVGDELVALAYRELLKTKSPAIARVAEIFTEGVVEVCEGQAYDKEFETQKNVSLNDYLLMIGKKTGKLVAVASEIGAVVGGGTAAEIRALQSYGELVGRAFQVQDDLLDVVADEKEFGKTIGGDIVEGKKTLLMIEAFRRSRGADKKLLRSIIVNRGTSAARVDDVREIYRRYGIIEEARQLIARDTENANRHLHVLRSSDARAMLYGFSDMLLKRNY